ncbi:MAG: MBL fold metallo-hydrolase [Alphaproteobacteria bacterium GM202ARS2]|nr:MBL fold metallo-hydrolase [Alphaproteobacteria bacterium GM202ARS2]
MVRYFFVMVVMVSAGVLGLSGCAGAQRIEGKPWHHTTAGFRNIEGSPPRGASFSDRVDFFSTRLWASATGGWDDTWPDDHVYTPEQVQESLALLAESDSLMWIGHATFLLHLDGRWILTDPFFAERASPVSWAGPKRAIMPPLSVSALPKIDIIVVSHNHYEHLCASTIEAMPNKETVTVVVPLEMGVFFRERGYKRVIELDWWQSVDVDGITVHMMPAVHWSRRGLFDGNEMLWASFAIESASQMIYHSGDTDMHPTLFTDIGRYLGRCDVALMGIGAYEPRSIMRGSHMLPEDAVTAGQQLGCRSLIGQHWGTIRLSNEPFMEPEERFFRAAQKVGQHVEDMAIGQSLRLMSSDP